jgi:hypothetical protein
MLCLDERLASDLFLRLFLTTSANYLDLNPALAPASARAATVQRQPEMGCEVAHVCLPGA